MLGPEPPPSSASPIQVASGSSRPPRAPARKVALVGPSDAPTISTSVAAPPPADIARQARLLGKALQSLRQDHDARAALAALDEHAAQFPDGALAPEADITRVDALLALDRRQAALGILDRMVVPATTRGRELVLVRAELRVGARRYAEAVQDFTRALAAGPSDDALSERAWHGRIACYLATGDRTRAQADLREYLNHFPDGRFAPEIRRALDEIERRR
jgi:tetratricopeptide (TPR) repeat protein